MNFTKENLLQCKPLICFLSVDHFDSEQGGSQVKKVYVPPMWSNGLSLPEEANANYIPIFILLLFLCVFLFKDTVLNGVSLFVYFEYNDWKHRQLWSKKFSLWGIVQKPNKGTVSETHDIFSFKIYCWVLDSRWVHSIW